MGKISLRSVYNLNFNLSTQVRAQLTIWKFVAVLLRVVIAIFCGKLGPSKLLWIAVVRGLFGTDGIRGEVLVDPITPDFMMRLGVACANFVRGLCEKNLVVIGCDTRASCCMIELAIIAGLLSRGVDVELIGCMPTPSVSYWVRKRCAGCGVMVSSSHNAGTTNGVKFFNCDGYKFSPEQERWLEEDLKTVDFASPVPGGSVRRIIEAEDDYVGALKEEVAPSLDLKGVRIALDCANGAASGIAERVFEELGARVISLHSRPDGVNINYNCGVLSVADGICKAVLEHKADFGVALDGDGDRLLICDAMGELADGDQLLAHIALGYLECGEGSSGVVCTVISNSGLDDFLRSHGVNVIRTDVGERSVIEAMLGNKVCVGGENSGHIIMSNLFKTSDGIAAALRVFAVMKEHDRPLRLYKPYPQVFRNVPGSFVDPLSDEMVAACVEEMKRYTGGRIVVRKSGTEEVVRVMVECSDENKALHASDVVCGAIAKAT